MLKTFFHYAQENTKYYALENTKYSARRVAYLRENSVRNFLSLENTKYSVSLEADSVKKFLRYALESSRYHDTLHAHRV